MIQVEKLEFYFLLLSSNGVIMTHPWVSFEFDIMEPPDCSIPPFLMHDRGPIKISLSCTNRPFTLTGQYSKVLSSHKLKV